MPQRITGNTLFYGDNLDILREYIPSESVDLIYLNPPFNSNRNYNVLFRDEGGQYSWARMRTAATQSSVRRMGLSSVPTRQ